MTSHMTCPRCALLLSISMAFLLVALLLPTSHGSELKLVPLGDRDAEAVCMDGTPSGYYWKDSTSAEGRHHWIIYLQSGGWCWGPKSCADRCKDSPTYCSSKDWEQKMEFDGVLSSINGELHASLRTANKIFVRYCTSDAHMGDASAFGYHFRGGRVVQAVLADLVQLHALGASDSIKDLLVFGGGSAGARGAMVHLDYVPSMLGSASKNVEVVGFLDSPFWLDVKPLEGASFEGFGTQTSRVFSFINATHLGDACAAAFNESLRWRCMLGEFRMPYVRTRYLMVAALHDSFQMWHNTKHSDPWTKEQLQYAEEFAVRTAKLIAPLASQNHAVFGQACHSHAESLWDSGFFRHAVEDGSSVSDAMHLFLGLTDQASGSNSSFRWIDECTKLDCGSGCHRGDNPCDGHERPCGDAEDDTGIDLNGSPCHSLQLLVIAVALASSVSVLLGTA